MNTTFDKIMTFDGVGCVESRCRVRVLADSEAIAVIVATELADNPGTTITNAAETVFQQAALEAGVGDRELVCIEHWPARKDQLESFDEVDFADAKHFRSPSWHRLSEKQVDFYIPNRHPESWGDAMKTAQEVGQGRCRRCGRKLRSPKHAAAGIGPVCARKEPVKA